MLDKGGAVLAAQMEHELRRVGGIGRMAAHALSRSEGALDDGLLVEGMNVALIDADTAVGGVARRHLAVSHAVVRERSVTDVHDEIAPLRPSAVLVAQDREEEGTSGVLRRELMPFADIEGRPAAAGLELPALAARDLDEHAVVAVRQVEVHRSDAGGDGDSDVIGIDVRKLLDEGRASGTGGSQDGGDGQEQQSFHFSPSHCLSRCQAL